MKKFLIFLVLVIGWSFLSFDFVDAQTTNVEGCYCLLTKNDGKGASKAKMKQINNRNDCNDKNVNSVYKAIRPGDFKTIEKCNWLPKSEEKGSCVMSDGPITGMTQCRIVDKEVDCDVFCAIRADGTYNWGKCVFTPGEDSCTGKSTALVCRCKSVNDGKFVCNFHNNPKKTDCTDFDNSKFQSCEIYSGDQVDCQKEVDIVNNPEVDGADEVGKIKLPENLKELKKINFVGEKGAQELIGRLLKIIMGVIGTIALVMFVYGGLMWMISAGSAEKTKKAMDIILWSSLGVIVMLASYAIVNFVFGLF